MRFKDWLFTEIQHVRFGQPININGVVADSIDFRFEDWKKGYKNPEKESWLPPSGAQNFFMASTFSAPLADKTFLNINLEVPMGESNLAVQTQVLQRIAISPVAQYAILPHGWFDFAMLLHGNTVVKPPEWPRDPHEAGKITRFRW